MYVPPPSSRLHGVQWGVVGPVLLGVHRLLFSAPARAGRAGLAHKMTQKQSCYHSAARFSAMPTSSSQSQEVQLGLWGASHKIVRDNAYLGFGETSANFTYQILPSEELCMQYWARNAGFTAFMHDCPFSSRMRGQLIYA